MSDHDQSPAPSPEHDDGPTSALMKLPAHLRRFAELREIEGMTLEQCVEAIRPGQYASPRDAGFRWHHRKDVQAAMLELRQEAIKRSARSAADVLNGMWAVADRCMQKVRPVLDRRGEQVTTDTPEGPALAFEFDSNGAMRAYESLANYHGMIKQRTEITGKDGGPIETETKVNLESRITPERAAQDYAALVKGD
jgi:hypothetical protein